MRCYKYLREIFLVARSDFQEAADSLTLFKFVSNLLYLAIK